MVSNNFYRCLIFHAVARCRALESKNKHDQSEVAKHANAQRHNQPEDTTKECLALTLKSAHEINRKGRSVKELNKQATDYKIAR